MPRQLDDVRARFRNLAGPTWDDLLWEAGAKLEESQRRRRDDGRVRQFNVTIADRPQLDALSEVLDLPRSKVINLALSLLAKKHELRADWYADVAADVGEALFRHLTRQAEMLPNEAKGIAADVWKGQFPQFHHVQARLRDGYSRTEVEADVWDLLDVQIEQAQPRAGQEERDVWKRVAGIYDKLGNRLEGSRSGAANWYWTDR